ncbi:Uncharacterized protein TCAP_03496 [Tolypocladium capitatum]|uniref:Uncharacterized protein n=1 Tax=Tolypocladium capitatum TaxID=45235 RepID=A0A2K3QG99_9HYPO|nr:Uncharacterized protein TCAP_03496 [Tolypocladium capitatum]
MAEHAARLLLVGAFIPAFPLCLVHGILSHHPVPAVGLVPQAVSVAVAALLLRVRRAGDAAVVDDEEGDERNVVRERLTHPVTIFVVDAILAAALMVVLVFTWTTHTGNASLSMLAAYATIPLLTSLQVSPPNTHGHLESLIELTAACLTASPTSSSPCTPSMTASPTRLRPSLPEFPWLRHFRRPGDAEYAPVLVDDAGRYRDEPGDGEEVRAEQPEAVEVRSKDRRGKGAAAAAAGGAPWGA